MTKFTMQDLIKLRDEIELCNELESRKVNPELHYIDSRDNREIPDYQIETELMYEDY